MSQVRYRSGYRYQLRETTTYRLPPWFRGVVAASDGYIDLRDGVLTIAAGYAWDGASGPAIDTPDFMGPSLVHDALYQLGEEGKLPIGWRRQADDVLFFACRANSMWLVRAWWVWLAVHWFGGLYGRRPWGNRTRSAVLMEISQ